MEDTTKKKTRRTTKKASENKSDPEQNLEISKEQNKRIMNAALDVVNKQTIAGTRMHLIADRAKMVQSNVHYYYKTKNELLLALQEYIFEECYDARRKEKKHSKDNLESQLDVFINQKKRLIMTKHKYDFAEIDFWVQSKSNDEIHGKFGESYTKWRREIKEMLEKYCPWMEEKSKELLPYTLVSLMQGATIQYMINKDEFDIEGYFDQCKQLILSQINNLRQQFESTI
ncbi:MAG: TetR family transcriptional regulator [Herbinix sp.]|jgi:AcrR family transcriptional regulator|nr:TetR family transcriptional regulator [Herbinix sp.]